MFTITNATEKPVYITSSNFDTWFDKFNTALRGIGLPPFLAYGITINITFSDEEKTSDYGSLSIEELKNLILSIWGHHKDILDILRHINNYDDYRHSIQKLMGVIERIRLGNETLPSPGILHAYLEDLQFSMPTMGEYTRNTRTITLFTKNIEAAAKEHGNTPSQEFERVFIHELFHAYHYIDSHGKDRTELKYRTDYTSTVVKESLASAFEWNYCITNKIAGHNCLYTAWRTYSVLSYPYSGAIELLAASTASYTDHLDNKQFCDVFGLSLTDMDGALRILVPNQFYPIKKLGSYQIHTTTKTVPVLAAAKPNVFKINSSKSFCLESSAGYIYAPADTRHKEMVNVHTGDILLQIFGGQLHAISLVTKGCYYATAAHGQTKPGHYADATYLIFPTPIDIVQFKKDPSYPIRRYEPYIRAFDYPDFVRLLLNEIQKVYPQNAMCANLIDLLIS